MVLPVLVMLPPPPFRADAEALTVELRVGVPDPLPVLERESVPVLTALALPAAAVREGMGTVREGVKEALPVAQAVVEGERVDSRDLVPPPLKPEGVGVAVAVPGRGTVPDTVPLAEAVGAEERETVSVPAPPPLGVGVGVAVGAAAVPLGLRVGTGLGEVLSVGLPVEAEGLEEEEGVAVPPVAQGCAEAEGSPVAEGLPLSVTAAGLAVARLGEGVEKPRRVGVAVPVARSRREGVLWADVDAAAEAAEEAEGEAERVRAWETLVVEWGLRVEEGVRVPCVDWLGLGEAVRALPVGVAVGLTVAPRAVLEAEGEGLREGDERALREGRLEREMERGAVPDGVMEAEAVCPQPLAVGLLPDSEGEGEMEGDARAEKEAKDETLALPLPPPPEEGEAVPLSVASKEAWGEAEPASASELWEAVQVAAGALAVG